MDTAPIIINTCSGTHGYLLRYSWILAPVLMDTAPILINTCSGTHGYLLRYSWILAPVLMDTATILINTCCYFSMDICLVSVPDMCKQKPDIYC